MNDKVFLLIVSILFSGNLFAQVKLQPLSNSPDMYNHADNSIALEEKKISNSKGNAESDFYSQWALLKLYNHLGKTTLSKSMLEKIFQQAKQLHHNDMLLIAYAEQIKLYDLFNDHLAKRNAISKLEELHAASTSNIAQVECQFIKALFFNLKSDSSLAILQHAIHVAKQFDSREQLLQAYLLTGQILISKKSMYAESIQYLDTVSSLSNKWNAKKYLALSYMFKGDALAHQGKFDSAVANHRDALSLFLQLKDVNGIILTYKYLGNCEHDIKKYTDAIKYYQQGVALSLSSGFNTYLPILYQNLGNVYAELNTDSNLYYLEKGISTANEQHNKHALALANSNLAFYYANKGMYIKAKTLLEQAIQLFKSVDEYNNVSWVIPQLVTLTLNHHKHDRTNPNPKERKQLLDMLDEAVSLNADGNNYKNLQSIFQNYTQLALLSNDYKTAVIYQAKLIELNDTVYNQQRIKAALETSEKLKTAEQKNKIALLELKSTRERNKQQLMWLLFAFSILGALLFYRNYRKRMKHKNAQLLRKQKEEFRNQLSSDLHDEVGTMLTGLAMQSEIVSLSASGKQKESLEEISSISREAMAQMRDIVWTIDSRKDKYENLFERMKIHTEQQLHLKNIDHQFTIEDEETFEDISPEVRQNVFLIYKEIIANILKHSHASFVKISIFRSNQKTKIIVSDNGKATTSKNADGIGKLSMQQRAKTINGILHIDASNGYTVSLEF